jgi:hypothetical protein
MYILHGAAGAYVVWGCIHRRTKQHCVYGFSSAPWWRLHGAHPDMRLVPVPVRRMRLVLSHVSCCAIEPSKLERSVGSRAPVSPPPPVSRQSALGGASLPLLGMLVSLGLRRMSQVGVFRRGEPEFQVSAVSRSQSNGGARSCISSYYIYFTSLSTH